jgi:glycosyltransferase involved in cell wall biosynthesis
VAGSWRFVTASAFTAVAWARFQPRTNALASAFGGQAWFVEDGPAGSHVALRPLAYLFKSVQTWKVLSRADPKTVLVITPPVFAPIVAWLWCLVHRRTLVVDCHTGAFHSTKWAWARPVHRWLLRHVQVVLLHTEELESLVSGWGARTLLLPDDLPNVCEASPTTKGAGQRVLVAGSFDTNEPVQSVIDAARLLPDVEFRLTGDTRLLTSQQRIGAPANVVFTGYIPYAVFLGELQAADVVGVFSTDPRIMNRSAFEAVGLGCPLVLSDLPGLRSRFGAAALFCTNEPRAIAEALGIAIQIQDELGRRSLALQVELRAQRELAVARLQTIINGNGGLAWRQQNAS